jgi:N-acyl-D-amino-acid deacylase
LLALAACSEDPLAPIPISGTGIAELDSIVTGWMRAWQVPGGALAVATSGEIVHSRGYGYADLAHTEPVTPDHLFRVASVSKPITAIATLVAVEEGLLSLDAAAFDVLADLLPTAGAADARLVGVTVAHLLHHTGGFDLFGYPEDPLHRSKEIAAAEGVPSPPGPGVIVHWVAHQALGFDPGTHFAYTNVAYVILGRVLERASGMAYEEYVRTRVLDPAGASTAALGGPRREDRLAEEVEYESFFNAAWESIFEGENGPVAEPAYGGLNLAGLDASSAWVISAPDLVRLLLAVDGSTATPELLDDASRAWMLTNGSPSGESPYGAGWFLATAAEAQAAGFAPVAFADHGGGMPGTTAYVALREDGLALAAAFNSNRGDLMFVELARALHQGVADLD